MRRLACGHYLGDVVRREDVAGLVLTETRYRPRTRLPLHSHERAYWCLVRRGGYTERFASHTREVGPSTLACHPPNERHEQQFHDVEVWSFNLEFAPQWLTRFEPESTFLSRPAEFRAGPMIDLARRLYREFRQPDPFSRLAMEGLVLELLAEAGRRRSSATTLRPPTWLQRVRDALHARFDGPVSLAELARLAGVHPVHLATTFRRHCGTTVGGYLRHQRVEYAARRLTTTATPLAEIAVEAGFADQSHFTRVFRQLTGLTPARFRRSAHDDEHN